MKKKITKKLLLPLFLMALCFMTIKTPVVPPTMPEDTPPQVLIPFSDMEDADNPPDK